jgi:hypothetical protein
MDAANLNWVAVIVGTIAAFGLGMLWFSPRMFGKAWSAGSHNLTPPGSPPILAMLLTFLALFLLALVVGMTETNQAIGTAIAAILAAALIVGGMDLFSQKSGKATLIDSGYIVASGVLMVLAQAVF